ncbi:hypothetical protein DDZ18_12615 [Marinicauda salina]|uniref:DUF2336 domain-containing protein n=1 Tax=Marinicauda salina TaxID=2135793 RepID=A0A2U2BRF9_9PROT|nr:DUF2336 domain-containing protein [Marinicauda salina]PWE16603.1 hypothetical protein DDZ18_12615 [Marinicauda salina]
MGVETMRARLTADDVRRICDSGDERARADAARKVCQRISFADLGASDQAAAEQIVRILAADAADRVRRALAVTLQRSDQLPHDVARKLAEDIESIAVPVIAGSPVLTDEDLVEIVRGGDAIRQTAVASRPRVSSGVVREIVARGASSAVGAAASNDGADFDDESYDAALERFADAPAVLERFVERSHLPVEITERLISQISDAALEKLVSRHALPPQLAVELAEGARERATVDLVEQAGLAPDPRRFAQQLQLNGRLTPSLILRALFRGHVSFFEHCVAELAAIDHAKAWLLIHDAGPLGLQAVFERTGLPKRILPAVKAALSAWHSLEVGDGGVRDQIAFRKRLTERIFTQFQGAPEADLNYCLERLDADERLVGEDEGLRAAS